MNSRLSSRQLHHHNNLTTSEHLQAFLAFFLPVTRMDSYHLLIWSTTSMFGLVTVLKRSQAKKTGSRGGREFTERRGNIWSSLSPRPSCPTDYFISDQICGICILLFGISFPVVSFSWSSIAVSMRRNNLSKIFNFTEVRVIEGSLSNTKKKNVLKLIKSVCGWGCLCMTGVLNAK